MRRFKSLRNKFVQTMLLVASIIAASTFSIVVVTSTRASSQHLHAVQSYIERGMTSKGRLLAKSHALALRGMTLDNAFLDMQRLIENAVQDDSDLVYGLYVNSEREPLAYFRRGSKTANAPARLAWHELAIPSDQLLVNQVAVRQTTQLGQAVLDVAAPVFDENSELLGTVHYGLSLSPMHEALRQARTEASQRLLGLLALSGALVGSATLLGLLLSRIQAVRITQPIGQLTQAAELLARGDRSVRVAVASGDEIEKLGSSFNRMIEDLDASYRKLEEMNRTLEQKVVTRTAELGQRNRDMRLVLDNVDQGFLTLHLDGTMASERSAVLCDWFGACDTPLPFWDYIGRHSPNFAATFELGWEQLREGCMPLEVCIAQFPEQLGFDGRSFGLRYLPILRDRELEGVLVVIAETTERLAREREDAEQHELLQVFRKLMLDRMGFGQFMRESAQMVEAVTGRNLDRNRQVLKRTLHTLKGNSASLGLSVIAGLCHQLEGEIDERGATTSATLAALSKRFQTLVEHAAALGGDGRQRLIEVPEAEYQSALNRLREEHRDSSELLQQMLRWRLEPAGRALGRLAEQAVALARRLDKGELEVSIDADGVRLDPERWQPFYSALTHLIRNAVDHGLETPEERRAAGKSERGRLRLSARLEPNLLLFEIGDDGRGIDWRRVAERAERLGLPHDTAEELLDALCHDGLSTSAEITQLSGRGVGMAAVRERVELAGGRLEVESTRGAGTTWIVRFPAPTPQPSHRPRLASSIAARSA